MVRPKTQILACGVWYGVNSTHAGDPRREGVRPRGEDQVGVAASKLPADVLRPDHRYLVRWPLEAHGQDQCLPVGTRLYSYQDLRGGPFPFSSVLRNMVVLLTARRIP